MKKTVNLVLGLFLITSMIMPILGLASVLKDNVKLPQEALDSELYEYEYDDLVLSQTAKNLVSAANSLLSSENIYADNIEISLKKADDNSIYISSINIYISKEYEQKAGVITKVIGSNMSKEPVIIVSE